jgi:hypothetical protein
MALNDKLDGCGDPVNPRHNYYIQDTRQFVGNCVMFWRHEGKGYTCDFEEAGVFSGDDPRVHSDRDTDVPWPVMQVRASRVTHVDAQLLNKFKK